jgi:hypothetical protein
LQRGFDEFFGFLGGAHSYLNAPPRGTLGALRSVRRRIPPLPRLPTRARSRPPAAFRS